MGGTDENVLVVIQASRGHEPLVTEEIRGAHAPLANHYFLALARTVGATSV